MKPFIKRDEQMDARTDTGTHARTDIGHFIISRPGPTGRPEIINKKLCTQQVKHGIRTIDCH